MNHPPKALGAAALTGRHILLIVTGGIACYKSADLLRGLVKAGAQVQVVMSPDAERFITPLTMQALSGRPVFSSLWDGRPAAGSSDHMPHIHLGRQADLVLVAPATADFIARLAQGRCEDLPSLLCVARPIARVPLCIAPAMNREMWEHPATQRNVAQVQADGAQILGPGSGEQACGEVGLGRMLEPDELLAAVEAHFQPKLLRGRRVLITAGPTFEPLDPVRGLTNRSSGKMGFALARAVQEAGGEVTLVAGPVALTTPYGVRRVDVETAVQMHEAVMSRLPAADVFIATAAVADWRVQAVAAEKIKKDPQQRTPRLPELQENPDILADAARWSAAHGQRVYCVGFAAESHDLERQASEKRRRKGVPLLVGNLGPATFGQDDNALLVIDAQGAHALPRASKLDLARTLVAEIAQRLPQDL